MSELQDVSPREPESDNAASYSADEVAAGQVPSTHRCAP